MSRKMKFYEAFLAYLAEMPPFGTFKTKVYNLLIATKIFA